MGIEATTSVAVSGSPYMKRATPFVGFMPDDPKKDDNIYAEGWETGYSARVELAYKLWVFRYEYANASGEAASREGDQRYDVTSQEHTLSVGVGGLGKKAYAGGWVRFYLSGALKVGYSSQKFATKGGSSTETKRAPLFGPEIIPGVFVGKGKLKAGVVNPVSWTGPMSGTGYTSLSLLNPSASVRLEF